MKTTQDKAKSNFEAVYCSVLTDQAYWSNQYCLLLDADLCLCLCVYMCNSLL